MTGRTLLWRVLWSRRRDVALGSLLVMVHQAAEALVPVMIGVIVDRAIDTGDAGALVRWLVGLAVLFVGLSACGCIGTYVYERLEVGAAHEARMQLVRRLLDARGSRAATDTSPGELVSLASVDTARVGEGIAVVMLGAGAVVGTVGAAVLLLATSVRLGLVVLLGLPVVLVLVRLLSRPLEHRSAAEQEAVAAAAGVAADLVGGLRVLKGLGAEAAAAARYRLSSQTALRGALRTGRIEAAFEGVTLTSSGAFLVVVAWVGGRLALEGTISVGELVAALGLTQFLAGPLTRVSYVAATLAQGQGSARRIDEVVIAPPAIDDGSRQLPETARGELTLSRLGWSDGDRPPEAGDLERGGLDLAVEPGELVALVVEDPATATAVLDALDRSLDPEQGEITLDGVKLPQLDIDECRRALLVARHDADLFEGSLADNVAAAAATTNGAGPGNPVDDTDLVGRALASAAADEVAQALPDGLDSPVGEAGQALSGGQRQRVALARALAADPPVLVLHDPTTAVDAVTEHRIATRLRQLRAGKTTLVVTTSPSLLAVADRVVLVDGGTVVADGTHADLAARDGRYRDLVLS